MKLQVKLNKDEAQAYKNFAEVCKPNDVAEADFMKTIFLMGIEAMNEDLSRMIKDYAKENREELAASGITVIDGEDGDIRLASTEDLEHDLSGAPSISEGVLHDQEIKRIMDSEEDA